MKINTHLTKKNFLIGETLLTVFWGIVVWAFIKFVFPGHYFSWYPAIPVYYYIFGWGYIYMFDICRKYRPNKILSVYMGVKMVKMFVSILVLLFYVWFVKVHKKDFIMTFFFFYVLSILYESMFFYMFQMNSRKKKIKDVQTNETGK